MSSETIYLYKKTHNITGLQYLGKTTSSDPYKYQGSGKRWKRHIKKHGYDVTTEIIRECSSEEELIHWGIYYSKLWNVVEDKNWANLKEEAGEGGKLSEASKRKMSDAKKGEKNHNYGKTLSDETKHKISEDRKGEKNHNYGKPRSEETKQKLSEAFKGEKNPMYGKSGEKNPMYGKTGEAAPMYGKTHSDEARQKISDANKGKTFSDESKQKMSQAKKGKTLSDEHTRKLSESRKGKKYITNGIICTMIRPTDPLPEGFRYGRK
jgi:hypothetical protein